MNTNFFKEENRVMFEDFIHLFMDAKYKNKKTLSKKLYNIKMFFNFCLETSENEKNEEAAIFLKDIIKLFSVSASNNEKYHNIQNPKK